MLPGTLLVAQVAKPLDQLLLLLLGVHRLLGRSRLRACGTPHRRLGLAQHRVDRRAVEPLGGEAEEAEDGGRELRDLASRRNVGALDPRPGGRQDSGEAVVARVAVEDFRVEPVVALEGESQGRREESTWIRSSRGRMTSSGALSGKGRGRAPPCGGRRRPARRSRDGGSTRARPASRSAYRGSRRAPLASPRKIWPPVAKQYARVRPKSMSAKARSGRGRGTKGTASAARPYHRVVRASRWSTLDRGVERAALERLERAAAVAEVSRLLEPAVRVEGPVDRLHPVVGEDDRGRLLAPEALAPPRSARRRPGRRPRRPGRARRRQRRGRTPDGSGSSRL